MIVTTTHFGSHICAERSRRAEAAGAAMVMIMPPYHGATIRVPEAGIFEFFQTVSDAISIPIMIQDAPVSGTAAVGAVPGPHGEGDRQRLATSRSRCRMPRPSCAS